MCKGSVAFEMEYQTFPKNETMVVSHGQPNTYSFLCSQTEWLQLCGVIVLQQKLTYAFGTGTGHSHILRVTTIVLPKSTV